MSIDVVNDPEMARSFPLVSIVTPCYNSSKYIEKTILSVLGQTYSNIEYLVFDGGSTDGTLEIIDKYKDRIDVFVSESDNGQADALKKGFAKCHGSILAWINADDVYASDAIESMLPLFLSGADVVYGNMDLIDGNGNYIGARRVAPYIPRIADIGMLYGGFGIYQPAAFWTKSAYVKAGGVDDSFQFIMDTDLINGFVRNRARFKFIHKTLVQFRVHEDSKTSTLDRVRRMEHKNVLNALPEVAVPVKIIAAFACRVSRFVYHILFDFRYLISRVFQRHYRWVP